MPDHQPGAEEDDPGDHGREESPRRARAWGRGRLGAGVRESRERLERERDVARGLEAFWWILLETMADDPVEGGWKRMSVARQLRRLFAQDRGHRLRAGFSLERAAPREHLVEDGAECEDVRAVVGGLAAHLLRGHVARRAHDDALVGVHGSRGAVTSRGLRARQLGQPEIQDLHAPVAEHEEVRRLEIPMDQPVIVRRGEAARDLERDVDRLARRERPLVQTLAQGLALEKLGHEVGRSLVRAHIVEHENVGMVQGAGRARLLLEASETIRIGGERGGQHLDRDLTSQAGVARSIDLAHAPRAERRQDLVRAELCTVRDGHEGTNLAARP